MIRSYDGPVYIYACEKCSRLLLKESGNGDELKESAKEHLRSQHLEYIEDKFSNNEDMTECKNCSNSSLDTLVCPDCGHDHTNWYLGMYQFLDVYRLPEDVEKEY